MARIGPDHTGARAPSRDLLVKPDGRRLWLYGAHGPESATSADSTPRRGESIGQIRHNELRGQDVVYAVDRQERTFLPTRADCPLDPTFPGGAPTEIPVSWFEIAVFENRFPAFEAPNGAAEVVVYTAEHESSLAELTPERAEMLMWVWRDRYAELGARDDVDYVQIFENRGVEVGVTLHHPHGQIYGFPFLPPVPAAEREADRRRGGCAICALAAAERDDGSRIVHRGRHFTAFVPYAARWPYEVHVAADSHRASLLDCDPAELSDLAACLQAVTGAYDRLWDRALPYVMAMHQAPTDGHGDGHLHVEFYPPLRTPEKLKYLAGSEQGAGTFIVDALPEDTAAALRAALPDGA